MSPGYSPVLAGISNCVWAMWQVSSIVFIISGQTSCDWYQPLGHTQSWRSSPPLKCSTLKTLWASTVNGIEDDFYQSGGENVCGLVKLMTDPLRCKLWVNWNCSAMSVSGDVRQWHDMTVDHTLHSSIKVTADWWQEDTLCSHFPSSKIVNLASFNFQLEPITISREVFLPSSPLEC